MVSEHDPRNPYAPPRSKDDEGDGPAADAPLWLSERAWREFLAREPWARWAARLAVASLAAEVLRVGVVLLRSPSDVPRGTVVGTFVGMPFAIVSAFFLERCARRLRDARAAGAEGMPPVFEADRALLRGWGWMALGTVALTMAFLTAVSLGVIAGVK